MEHTKEAAVVPVDMGWSDVGSWSELWAISDKDCDENVIAGDVFAEDTTGSYIKTYTKMIATVGLRDMVVVDTGDTVLVAPKDRAQDIGTIVKRLEREGRTEHLFPGRVRRPWGWYQTLDSGDSFQVKRICVNAKARLSLQRHNHRAEHWVVVSGKASVQCNGKDITLCANQSTYIPVGASHRLENSSDQPLYLIEVQSGDYLGEDDIERLEDDFSRK
jgi:mannose-1-phosphate guanylyltransferase/mannose-6-phosphate isomerase